MSCVVPELRGVLQHPEPPLGHATATVFLVVDKWYVSHFSSLADCMTCPIVFLVVDKWHFIHFSSLADCMTYPIEFPVVDKWHFSHFSFWLTVSCVLLYFRYQTADISATFPNGLDLLLVL